MNGNLEGGQPYLGDNNDPHSYYSLKWVKFSKYPVVPPKKEDDPAKVRRSQNI